MAVDNIWWWPVSAVTPNLDGTMTTGSMDQMIPESTVYAVAAVQGIYFAGGSFDVLSGITAYSQSGTWQPAGGPLGPGWFVSAIFDNVDGVAFSWSLSSSPEGVKGQALAKRRESETAKGPCHVWTAPRRRPGRGRALRRDCVEYTPLP